MSENISVPSGMWSINRAEVVEASARTLAVYLRLPPPPLPSYRDNSLPWQKSALMRRAHTQLADKCILASLTDPQPALLDSEVCRGKKRLELLY